MKFQMFPQACGVAAAIVTTCFVAVPVVAQTPEPTSSESRTWVPPRTADGQPDLQGVWANDSITPLERPKELAGRQLLTDVEVAALKETAGQLFSGDGDAAFGDSLFQAALTKAKTFKSTDGGTGNYNHFWLVEREFDSRTSLIVEPSDGRVPALTPEAEKKAADRAAEKRARGPADSWEDRSLFERCITRGLPNLLAGYNSNYQILQTPQYVVIFGELIHDARIVPLDGRPHVGQSIRQWLGDSRGRWDGDTLVVDTVNFTDKTNFRGSGANLHLVERFTRVGPDTLQYQFTIDDPTTFTSPWTAVIPLKRIEGRVFEYACHEGNVGLPGILAGHRAEEKAAQGTEK